ncbi:uncharacterized protein TNIN_50721 [Trichonephila inaurata madagascariensis]|uniref:DUF5641 domain-containing protein n=1 Tax=Trichonephila inaurata madagascariensis TaxID=2747483 RepID=A0A8X7CEN1_9ARAC|nr:uncharacterized protein TNIN_50721 [Trichonephila inaurata madagascariensis]
MAKIIELIPGRDGKIHTVKLKTQHGTVLRPVQRVYPLEIRENENFVTEEVAGEGESNSKKGVNVTTAPNDVIKKYTSSSRCGKTPNRLDLFNYHYYRFDTIPEYQTGRKCCENSRALNDPGVE